ncbi:MAG: putative glycoside hydrolase [Patescibacteria group bacterium]
MVRKYRTHFGYGASLLLFVFLLGIGLPYYFKTSYSAALDEEKFAGVEGPTEPPVVHMATPEPLKALYMTACVAATPSWREDLKNLIDTTELNSVVIDIKDYSGSVSFEVGANCYVSDLKEFVSKLHQAGVYVIGRIAVFQDPRYTTSHPELAVKSLATGEVWKDYKGLSFIDVGAKPYWDYIVQISKASYELGFDELNYDYVRYPSDGDMEDADFTWMTASSTKPEMLESFFSYLYDNLQTYNLKTSVDLFGMTTTVTSDMGIGQVLEKALPYFDYIAPMVYPSHYPASWNGFVNPAEHPYEVIHLAMSEGKRREEIWRLSNNLATSTTSKLRPWLQDFNLGATYDATKVRAQIQATYDSGLTSWMIWSAANKYTKEALLRE